MSGFKEMLAADVEAIFINPEEFAEVCLYTKCEQDSFAFDGIVGPIRYDQVYEGNPDELKRLMRCIVTCSQAFLSDKGVTSIERGSTVTTPDGLVWVIGETETKWGPGTVVLGLEREPLVSKGEKRRAAI